MFILNQVDDEVQIKKLLEIKRKYSHAVN